MARIGPGTLAVVDGQRGVFRIAEPAPGPAPTWWATDTGHRWHAFRASRIHPVAGRCPEHPGRRPDPSGPRPRCPVCRALDQKEQA